MVLPHYFQCIGWNPGRQVCPSVQAEEQFSHQIFRWTRNKGRGSHFWPSDLALEQQSHTAQFLTIRSDPPTIQILWSKELFNKSSSISEKTHPRLWNSLYLCQVYQVAAHLWAKGSHLCTLVPLFTQVTALKKTKTQKPTKNTTSPETPHSTCPGIPLDPSLAKKLLLGFGGCLVWFVWVWGGGLTFSGCICEAPCHAAEQHLWSTSPETVHPEWWQESTQGFWVWGHKTFWEGANAHIGWNQTPGFS